MNRITPDGSLSCKEIVQLINELLDGDATTERREQARLLIKQNPQCKALHSTFQKTLELIRERFGELDKKPSIDWKKAGFQDGDPLL